MTDFCFAVRFAQKCLTVSLGLFLLFASPARSQSSSSQQSSSDPSSSDQKKPAPAAASPAPPSSAKFYEDWSTPLLDRSYLSMLPPTLAATDDVPGTGFIRKRYEALWRPQDPFDLYIITPRGVSKAPVIIYLYSFPDDTETFKDDHWCEAAVSGGYAAVGFVANATGHRTRYRLMKDWFLPSMNEALATTSHDVQLVLDYLNTRPEIDMSRVGMFGLGSGGTIGVLASAVDPRIRALQIVGPWGDWKDWVASTVIVDEKDRDKYSASAYLDKVAPLDPVVWLPKVKAQSLLIQDVRKNASMPDKAQEALEAAAPDFTVIDQFGNGRSYLTNRPPAMLFDWLKDQLKPGAKPAPHAEQSARVHFYPAVQPPPDKWPNVGTLDAEKEKEKAQTVAKDSKDKDKSTDKPNNKDDR
jgi:hypothetical protein